MRKPAVQMLCASRPAWLRHLLAVVAWVCLGTQLSALTHFLVVEHVRCAEHGEMIHAHEQHDGDESGIHLDAPSSNQRFTSSGEADDHGHDHCLVSSEKREAAAFSSTPSILASTSEQVAFLPEGFSELLLVARIYAFAPKTSPPAERSSAATL